MAIEVHEEIIESAEFVAAAPGFIKQFRGNLFAQDRLDAELLDLEACGHVRQPHRVQK